MIRMTIKLILVMILINSGMAYSQSMCKDSDMLIIPADNTSLLEIRTPQNLQCTINIETHSDNSIEVDFSKWASAKSLNHEKRFTDLIEVKIDKKTRRDNGIRLRILTPIKAPWENSDYSAGIDLEITVPDDFRIDSRNSYSEINIVGPLSSVRIDNEYGSVEVENIKGELDIKTSYSEVGISDIEGDINIETSYSGIQAEGLILDSNPGYFETSYGFIELNEIIQA